MMHDVKMGKRTRKSFSHIQEVLEMPDLIDLLLFISLIKYLNK